MPPFSQSSSPVCVSAAFSGDTVPLREPWHLWSRGRHFSMQDFSLHKLCSWRSAKGQFSGIFPRLWGSNGYSRDSPGPPDQRRSRATAARSLNIHRGGGDPQHCKKKKKKPPYQCKYLFCVQSQRLSGSWGEFLMMCDRNKLWQGPFDESARITENKLRFRGKLIIITAARCPSSAGRRNGERKRLLG